MPPLQRGHLLYELPLVQDIGTLHLRTYWLNNYQNIVFVLQALYNGLRKLDMEIENLNGMM